jgi:hypothetical protein
MFTSLSVDSSRARVNMLSCPSVSTGFIACGPEQLSSGPLSALNSAELAAPTARSELTEPSTRSLILQLSLRLARLGSD